MHKPVRRNLLPEFIASCRVPPPPLLQGDLTVGPVVRSPVPVRYPACSVLDASAVPLATIQSRRVLPPVLFEELQALKDAPMAQLHHLSELLFSIISGSDCRLRGLDGQMLLDEMLVISRGGGEDLLQELTTVLAGLVASANRNHPVLPKMMAVLAERVTSCTSRGQAIFLVTALQDVALARPNPELAAIHLRAAKMIDDLHGRYPDVALNYGLICGQFSSLDDDRRGVFAGVLLRALRLAPKPERARILEYFIDAVSVYWRRDTPPEALDRADIVLRPFLSNRFQWRELPSAAGNGEWPAFCAVALLIQPPSPKLIVEGGFSSSLEALLREACNFHCAAAPKLQSVSRAFCSELETFVRANDSKLPLRSPPLIQLAAASCDWLRGDKQRLPADLSRLLIHSPWRQKMLARLGGVESVGLTEPSDALIRVMTSSVGLILLKNPLLLVQLDALKSLVDIIQKAAPRRSIPAAEFLLSPEVIKLLKSNHSHVQLKMLEALAAIARLKGRMAERAVDLLLSENGLAMLHNSRSEKRYWMIKILGSVVCTAEPLLAARAADVLLSPEVLGNLAGQKSDLRSILIETLGLVACSRCPRQAAQAVDILFRLPDIASMGAADSVVEFEGLFVLDLLLRRGPPKLLVPIADTVLVPKVTNILLGPMTEEKVLLVRILLNIVKRFPHIGRQDLADRILARLKITDDLEDNE